MKILLKAQTTKKVIHPVYSQDHENVSHMLRIKWAWLMSYNLICIPDNKICTFLSNRVMYYHDTMCRCLSTGQWVYMHWHVRGRRITVLKSVTDDSLMVSWYHFFKRTPFQITLFSQLTNLIRKKTTIFFKSFSF